MKSELQGKKLNERSISMDVDNSPHGTPTRAYRLRPRKLVPNVFPLARSQETIGYYTAAHHSQRLDKSCGKYLLKAIYHPVFSDG